MGKVKQKFKLQYEPVVFNLHTLSYPGNRNKIFLKFLKVILKNNPGAHKAIFICFILAF